MRFTACCAYVNSTRAPQRAHEVLQELRDFSPSMAMEYFDGRSSQILKKKLPGPTCPGRLFWLHTRKDLCLCGR
ncbi:hypothetical protein PBY51_014645 [Eleginops maclovinus]|uniref:Uncharacterized protein n=1 Tax=Eleginops maclovinus TaxID=56733 RepID=A0AAN8AEZ3_ELEMC|nr:hypothetical protein PBY51_014645 [Eleginops maclovinus]